MGLGLSGESARAFLLSLGYPQKDIITFDEKSAQAQVSDPEDLFRVYQPQTLVVSPGVPLTKDWIVAAAARGVEITSEINLACSILESEVLIGVTGSVGKSTTVSLIGAVLTALDKNTFVGGNLGTAFCDYAREVHTGKRQRAKWVVLELSSYQLENCKNLILSTAAITSLTPNHLERYSSLESYYVSKMKILALCKGSVVLNQESKDLFSRKSAIEKLADKTCPLFWVTPQNTSFKNLDLSSTRLVGKHNLQNLAVAAKLLLELGIPSDQMKALVEFSGLAHRMEFFGTWNEINFINDSKATSIESVLMAVDSCLQKLYGTQKMHLLLGGRDKNLPWHELSRLSKNQNILFYFFGESKDLIPKCSGLPGSTFVNLDTCFSAVMEKAQKQDWVLLSPGGTSLDHFKNFEARGDFFKNLVQKYYSAR